MHGKIALVTGATSGLGKATAFEMARLGAMVILVGRSKEKCEATVDHIKKETGNDGVGYMVADLSVQREVRKVSQDFTSRHNRLHVLVNNVGGFFNTRFETEDGFELTFALNYLSHFLLTDLLLDVLKASSPARIINVSSGIHARERRMPFDDLQTAKGYKGFKAYGRSKLANILFTYELARRLEGTGVTVNVVNPGFTATGLGMQPGGFGEFTKWMVSKMAKTPQQGAETIVYVASSKGVEGVTGKYYENLKDVPSSKTSYNVEAGIRLWEISRKLTGLRSNTKP
ncbi:SDR family oxidoreductase [candidate division WOR-3 bacterium]|nr:SDR family oxidoreductase [candidate division WOR-3 bacterium]